MLRDFTTAVRGGYVVLRQNISRYSGIILCCCCRHSGRAFVKEMSVR